MNGGEFTRFSGETRVLVLVPYVGTTRARALTLIPMRILKIRFSFLQAKDVKITETKFNMEFVARVIPKLDWKVLVDAAVQVRS